MGVRPPAAIEGGTTQINPLGIVSDLANIQRVQNENTRFQLQQQAYQNLGAIAVQHPGDEEGAYREMLASPWAPYGQDFLTTMRQAELTGAQIAQTQAATGKTNLEAGDSVMHVFAKNLGPLYAALQMGTTDQATLDGLRDGAVAQTLATAGNMSESQKANAVNSMRAWYQSLYNNLPTDATRNQVLMSRIAPTIASSGLDGPGLTAILGSNFHVETPTQEGWGVQPPPYINGGVPILHAVINKGVPPKLAAPGEVGYPAQGGAGSTLGPLMAPNASIVTGASPGVPNQLGGQVAPPPPVAAPPAAAAPTPTAPVAAPPPPAAQVPPPAPVPDASAPATPTAPMASVPVTPGPTAADGRPLWDSNTNFNVIPHGGRMDASNTQWLWTDKDAQESAKESMQKFHNEEAKELQGSMTARYQYDLMDEALDRLAGTPLEPGTYGPQRLQIARGINNGVDLLQQAGIITADGAKNFKFDENTVAAGEGLTKSQRLAQFSTVTQAFGGGREAQQTIAAALQAVPGMDNSYLGNKLVLETLRQAAYRIQDLNQFKLQWLRQQGGRVSDLTGAEQEFNRIHPPEEYANRVLEAHGLSKDGFTSEAAIMNARQHGWITSQMAGDAFKKLQSTQQQQPTQQP